MTISSSSLYPDFKRIWTFGLSYSAMDGRFRQGLVRYRGSTKKWLLRETGNTERLDELRRNGETCDLLLGRINNETDRERLIAFNVPIMDLAEYTVHPNIIPTAQLDFSAAGTLAARHFRSMGYRNFSFFYDIGIDGKPQGAAREGFVKEVAAAGGSFQSLSWENRKCASRRADGSLIARQSLSEWMKNAPKPMAMVIFDSRQG